MKFDVKQQIKALIVGAVAGYLATLYAKSLNLPVDEQMVTMAGGLVGSAVDLLYFAGLTLFNPKNRNEDE